MSHHPSHQPPRKTLSPIPPALAVTRAFPAPYSSSASASPRFPRQPPTHSPIDIPLTTVRTLPTTYDLPHQGA